MSLKRLVVYTIITAYLTVSLTVAGLFAAYRYDPVWVADTFGSCVPEQVAAKDCDESKVEGEVAEQTFVLLVPSILELLLNVSRN